MRTDRLPAIREAVEALPDRSTLIGPWYEEAAVAGFVSRRAVLDLLADPTVESGMVRAATATVAAWDRLMVLALAAGPHAVLRPADTLELADAIKVLREFAKPPLQARPPAVK